MRFRFLHFADCHLGYWQYNRKERFNDFGRAYLGVIKAAIDEQVDFVLLAGDLFQKRAIDALTLNQAIVGLERLKAAKIPCIAVEGNHEAAYYHEQVGWLQFLALRNLLILLNPEFEGGQARLTPYANRKGSYVDILPGVRVHGLKYFGAGAAAALEKYAAALEQLPRGEVRYSIFMAHGGVEGVVDGQQGGLSLREWGVLRPHVDYVALGHVHKPFAFDDWIYNPGSLESCTIAEAEWPERGYYLVEVDTERADGVAKHTARLIATPRRAFHRLLVKTDLFTSPDDMLLRCCELFQRKARDLSVHRLGEDERPVVEVLLTGALPFDRSGLDLRRVEELVADAFDPLFVLVKNNTTSASSAFSSGEFLSRAELEQQVMVSLLNQYPEFREHSDQWAAAAVSLKRLAVSHASAEAIVSELEAQIERIQKLVVSQN